MMPAYFSGFMRPDMRFAALDVETATIRIEGARYSEASEKATGL
jgi:hypothetical protein